MPLPVYNRQTNESKVNLYAYKQTSRRKDLLLINYRRKFFKNMPTQIDNRMTDSISEGDRGLFMKNK